MGRELIFNIRNRNIKGKGAAIPSGVIQPLYKGGEGKA